MSLPPSSRFQNRAARLARPGTWFRLLVSLALCWGFPLILTAEEPSFPVKPELFIDSFKAAEGISFNAEGKLFIAANRAAWLAQPDGSVAKLADTHTNLGMAGIGERDILMADFGPTNVFNDGENDDGIVWRITPDGQKSVAAKGIADPNFILVMADGSYLVSDDGTNKIYRVTPDGQMRLWSTAIDFPNGMALSRDGQTLYVAQIFKQINPVVFDGRLWALPVKNFLPAGEPTLVAEVGKGLDGLAMDERGRVYIADNQNGKIWRYSPESGDVILIAEGMPNVASMVFGEGAFDHQSLYAACTFRGGGKIWRIPVGVKTMPQHR